MENAKISQQRESIIVKKGFFYYLGQFIRLFFKAIALILKMTVSALKTYVIDIDTMISQERKTKRLLKRKDIDEEIV